MQKDHGESPVVTDDAEPPSSVAELTAEIVSAYVSNNRIAPSELAKLITTVAGELDKIGTKVEPPTEEKAEPAVPVRGSIRPDHLVCLICGKPQKMFKRHFAVEHELTPDEYREPLVSSPTIRWRPKLHPAATRVCLECRPGAAQEAGAPPTEVDRPANSACGGQS